MYFDENWARSVEKSTFYSILLIFYEIQKKKSIFADNYHLINIIVWQNLTGGNMH